MAGRRCEGGSGEGEITRAHCYLDCVQPVKVWLIPLGLCCHSVSVKQFLRCVSTWQVTG